MRIPEPCLLKAVARGALVLLFSAAQGGCCTTNGLVKTPLAPLEARKFPSVGIRMQLPKASPNPCKRYEIIVYDSLMFQTNTQLKAELVVRMHWFWSGPQGLAEPSDFLGFEIARLSPEQFEVFCRGQHFLNGSSVFGPRVTTFHADIQEQIVTNRFGDSRKWRCFRKDIRLPNGDVVVVGAQIIANEGAVPNIEEDIKAIKEILHTVQPF